jgi:hypothetical protein
VKSEPGPAAHAPLSAARADFPAVLGLGCGNGLPLHVRNRVGSAATERGDVIFAVAGASAAGPAGRRAGMLALEFPRHLSGWCSLADSGPEKASAIASAITVPALAAGAASVDPLDQLPLRADRIEPRGLVKLD